MAPIKKVCIFGVGGVGGYFGAQIAHAVGRMEENGYAVYFVSRKDHLKAITLNGLTLVTPEQTITARPTIATDDLSRIPAFDLVLLCVKSYDLKGALYTLQPKVTAQTLILPLQNGIDIHARIRSVLQKGIVLPACVYVGTHIHSPGVIHSNGGNGRILWGQDPEKPNYSSAPVADYFKKVGVDHKYSDNPYPAIWEKFIFIAAFALTTAYFEDPIGKVLTNPQAKALTRAVMAEIFQLAKAKNIALKETSVDDSITKASHFPVDTKTSYQRDIELKGRINEGDLLGGTIIRMGRQLGLATPVTKRIYTQIQKKVERENHGQDHC